MKKRILTLTLAAILALAPLTSCQAQEEGQGASNISTTPNLAPSVGDQLAIPIVEYPETNPDAFPYYLDLLVTATDVTATGATLNFYHPDGLPMGTMVTTSWFALETMTDFGSWRGVVPHPNADRDVPLTETAVENRDGFELTVDWSDLYGALEPGVYRIVKYIEYTRPDAEGTLSFLEYASFVVEAEPFAGRGLTLANVPVEDMPISDPLVDLDLMLVAEDVTPFGMTVRAVKQDGTTAAAFYDKAYHLERFDGKEWENMISYEVMQFAAEESVKGTLIHSIDWTRYYGELAPGVYRIVKEIHNSYRSADYYAYFEIPQ